MKKGRRTLDRPELFRESVSELKRHSKMSWPAADSSLSLTSSTL